MDVLMPLTYSSLHDEHPGPDVPRPTEEGLNAADLAAHSASLFSALRAAVQASAVEDDHHATALQDLDALDVVARPPRLSSLDTDIVRSSSATQLAGALADASTTKALPPLPSSSLYSLAEHSTSAPDLSLGSAPELPLTKTSITVSRGQQRFSALMELVATEVGYLADLRAINEVYLPQLSRLSAASPTIMTRISRNMTDLVALHEALSEGFCQVDRRLCEHGQSRSYPSTSYAVGADDHDVVLEAVEAVCRQITDASPGFAAYGPFCAQHLDATAAIAGCAASRAEYEAFEMGCASLIAFKSPQLAPHPFPAARLRMLDYMIKPIQRVCRYPLLLRALLASLDEGSSSYVAAAAALSRMRDIADSVDAARQHNETEARTLLVASRMEMPSAAQPAFLSLLGTVKAVGAVQFVQRYGSAGGNETPVGPLRVKYHGILLYATHLVFFKVRKADCYEPRHWFPLRALQISAISAGEGLLGHALRIVCGENCYELGCHNAAEQRYWTDNILSARDEAVASWTARVAENPVETPFDDTSVSSVYIDAEDTPRPTPVDAVAPALPLPAVLDEPSRFSQMLGRTSAAMRQQTDERLADVFSPACRQARDVRVDRYARTHPARSLSTPQRRPAMDAAESASSVALAASAAKDESNPSSRLRSRPTLSAATRSWHVSWRNRRDGVAAAAAAAAIEGAAAERSPSAPATTSSSVASLPALAALAGPVIALVSRNASTSSSGSSAPPSPALATPTEADAPRWLFPRSKSSVNTTLPSYASPEEEERARAAEAFLRSGSQQSGVGPWSSWRRAASASLSSNPALRGIFKPTVSSSMQSSASTAVSVDIEPEESMSTLSFGIRRRTYTAPEASVSNAESSMPPPPRRPLSEARRKSGRFFRNLSMTQLVSQDA